MSGSTFRSLLAGVLMLFGSDPACAGTFRPIVQMEVEHGSNDTEDPPQKLRQTVQRIAGGFEYDSHGDGSTEGRQVFVEGLVGIAGFDDFAALDSTEYTLRGSVTGPLVSGIDGRIEALSARRFSSLSETFSGKTQESENRLGGRLVWQAVSRLEVASSAEATDTDVPLAGAQDLSLRTSTLRPTARLRLRDGLYLGFGLERTSGDFRNTMSPLSSDYEDRKAFGLLEFRFLEDGAGWLELGETKRQPDDGSAAFDETYWGAGVHLALTPKTSINFEGGRDIENHFGRDVAAYVVQSYWNAGLNWKITGKTEAYYGYGRGHREFLRTVISLPTAPSVDGRKDDYTTQVLKFTNRSLGWLLTELYFQRDELDSNRDSYVFDGYLIGLKFEARKFKEIGNQD